MQTLSCSIMLFSCPFVCRHRCYYTSESLLAYCGKLDTVMEGPCDHLAFVCTTSRNGPQQHSGTVWCHCRYKNCKGPRGGNVAWCRLSKCCKAIRTSRDTELSLPNISCSTPIVSSHLANANRFEFIFSRCGMSEAGKWSIRSRH